jgi:hypothetical protein
MGAELPLGGAQQLGRHDNNKKEVVVTEPGDKLRVWMPETRSGCAVNIVKVDVRARGGGAGASKLTGS